MGDYHEAFISFLNAEFDLMKILIQDNCILYIMALLPKHLISNGILKNMIKVTGKCFYQS